MDKCQAPGLECEECRLKCQLPLIEAEKAQRERLKRMTPYQSWSFCEAINCHAMKHLSARVEMFCQNCKAYQMHTYLKEHGQILEEGSGIMKAFESLTPGGSEFHNDPDKCIQFARDRMNGVKRIKDLEVELARLQVALDATIAEKEKYKRALKTACEINSDMFATPEEAMNYCIGQAKEASK